MSTFVSRLSSAHNRRSQHGAGILISQKGRDPKVGAAVWAVINYLLLKRPPYWLPIDASWPSIDIQLLLQQKCCANSLLSSIWPLSGPLVTLIWALVSTNTLTMPKRMRGTSKTVRSVHTEQTYGHTVHTEWTYVHSVATV